MWLSSFQERLTSHQGRLHSSQVRLLFTKSNPAHLYDPVARSIAVPAWLLAISAWAAETITAIQAAAASYSAATAT